MKIYNKKEKKQHIRQEKHFSKGSVPTSRKPLNAAKGYTLMEVIVAIVILTVLALIVTSKFIDHIDDANTVKLKSDARLISNQLVIELIDNPNILENPELTVEDATD